MRYITCLTAIAACAVTSKVNANAAGGIIANGDSVEVRIGLGENSGLGSKGLFVQGIQLEGAAVPEPSSAILALLAGGAFVFRRRR